jgi:hypothetical protein
MDGCARGQEIYDTKYKNVLEPAMNGKYAVIDLATGDISIAERFQSLGNILRSTAPGNRSLYVMLIGVPALFTMG